MMCGPMMFGLMRCYGFARRCVLSAASGFPVVVRVAGIVAGFVTGRVFLITDIAQWVLAPLVSVLGLILIRPMRLYGGPLAWAGSSLLVGALILTLWHNGVMGPRMAGEIQTYRTAAEANDREAAVAAMTSFEVDHKTAERLFGLRWCLLLGTVAAFAGGQRRRPEESVERP